MILKIGSLVTFLAGLVIASAAAASADDACRAAYLVPYAEQCDFDYRSIAKDASLKNVAAAYAQCDRAQNAALSCVKTPDKRQHAIATHALYRDVTDQAEIALFIQHYALGEALLREKSDVLHVIEQDGKPNDPVFARERASIASEIQDAKAGECTQHALSRANDQVNLAHAHRYGDLAALLNLKYQDYSACAPVAATPQKRAYIRYQGLVALEESGRAAQAARQDDVAKQHLNDCIASSTHEMSDASSAVRKYLTIIHDLCAGRLNGRYSFNQPQPLDADASKGFVPVMMPEN